MPDTPTRWTRAYVGTSHEGWIEDEEPALVGDSCELEDHLDAAAAAREHGYHGIADKEMAAYERKASLADLELPSLVAVVALAIWVASMFLDAALFAGGF